MARWIRRDEEHDVLLLRKERVWNLFVIQGVRLAALVHAVYVVETETGHGLARQQF